MWWWTMVAVASGETTVLDAPALRIVLPQGVVSVSVDPAATTIALDIDRARWGEHCQLTVAVEGGEAVVRGVRSGGAMRMCRANVVARVPPVTRIAIDLAGGDIALAGVAGATVEMGIGDLVVTAVSGALDVNITSGDLVGSFLGDSLRARVGSGQIRLAGLRAPADVGVSLGKVELAYDSAPEGEIVLSSGAGKATVILPFGTTVALGATDARMGNVVNELAVDETSKTVIRGSTHAGNVEILAGTPPAVTGASPAP